MFVQEFLSHLVYNKRGYLPAVSFILQAEQLCALLVGISAGAALVRLLVFQAWRGLWTTWGWAMMTITYVKDFHVIVKRPSSIDISKLRSDFLIQVLHQSIFLLFVYSSALFSMLVCSY